MVKIKGLDKAEVLKALYNNTHAKRTAGGEKMPEKITAETCRELLSEGAAFPYLFGSVIGVDLSGDEIVEYVYDREYGKGAAQRAVDSVREMSAPPAGEDKNTEAEEKTGGNEKSTKEKAESATEAIIKILDILIALPDEESWAAAMALEKHVLRPLAVMTFSQFGSLGKSDLLGKFW